MGLKKRRASGKRKQRGFVRTAVDNDNKLEGLGTGETTGEGTGASTGESTGGDDGGVGLLSSTNRVEVDAAKIEADMAAAAGAAETAGTNGLELGGQDGGALEPVPSSWAPICPGIVMVLDLFVVPNWKLRQEERTALEESLAPVLDDLFPGGAGDARWAPYFRLAFVAGGIALTRLDRETGKFPPLRIQADEDDKAREARERDAADDAAHRAAAGMTG